MDTPSPAVAKFRQIAEDWITATSELLPEVGSEWGIAACEPLLSENTAALRRQVCTLNDRTLRAVESLPEAAFRGNDWLDRRGFLSLLRTSLTFDKALNYPAINPQVHCQTAVQSVFELVVRHAHHIAPALPAIESRLAAIPDFLAAGAAQIKRPVPLWVELTEQACAGTVSFLNALEHELNALSPHPHKTSALIDSAARAFRDYARSAARKTPAPATGYAVGRSVMEYLVAERTGLDLTLPEIRANGEYLVRCCEEALRAEAARLGKRSARQLLDAAADAWNPGGSLIDAYSDTTSHLRQKLATVDFVTLPDRERLDVRLVPDFLRHQFPTAAYSAPSPFAEDQTGIFWVNDLSLNHLGVRENEQEVRQHFGIDLTSVHEAYPGHHLQFVIQNRHPSRIRRLFSHAIFYEGWTMWCEQWAVALGLADQPTARIQQLSDALWRAHRIVIDCGLHDGSLSISQASRILQKHLGFTEARAQADINWYTSSPTVPMSYLLGRLEVENLHHRITRERGWNLREFNDWLLSHGSLPPAWIARAG